MALRVRHSREGTCAPIQFFSEAVNHQQYIGYPGVRKDVLPNLYPHCCPVNAWYTSGN